MLFNSLEFAVFFIIVYSLYLIFNHKWQNRLLLLASYVFYGWWDYRFLSLILISTLLDYYCGIKIHESNQIRKRKLFLWLSVCGNLGILGFFKYCNFFVSSLQVILTNIGFSFQPFYLRIILPLGISFYTFQTMSYTIDIYRKEMVPTRKFFDFALFVAFFPQLLAGPIERAKHLLPQVLASRKIDVDRFEKGAFLIFWGLFQKVFVADNLARISNAAFLPQVSYNGVSVLLGVFAFAFQIFCDFAGYSNIARGLGKLMGFDIVVNFNFPLFAANIQDFWKRWHISLSSWARDYIYIPLKKSKRVNTLISVMITMVAIGFWHGAAWHFIFAGAYCGILLIIHAIIRYKFKNLIQPKSRLGSYIWRVLRMIVLQVWLLPAGILFRAPSMKQAFSMLQGLFFNFDISAMDTVSILGKIFYFIWFLVFIQAVQFIKKDFYFIQKSGIAKKALFYTICCYLFIKGGFKSGEAFIYFIF